jgi:hypothetical protein
MNVCGTLPETSMHKQRAVDLHQKQRGFHGVAVLQGSRVVFWHWMAVY